MIRVSDQPFEPGKELEAYTKSASESGAVVSFLGKVRATADANTVVALELEHFPEFTESAIAKIEAKAMQRWNIDEPLIIHRVGRLRPDDPIVFVCVSAVHRREAFEAADFLMDYLKSEAPFWKKEIREGGEVWIEPRDNDYKDVERWRRNEDNA